MTDEDAPHYTAACTLMINVWRTVDDRDGKPQWGTPAPTLADLKWLREPDFNWPLISLTTFFDALVYPAMERRIADNHKGLLVR